MGYIRLSKSAKKANCQLSELINLSACELAELGWSNDQISALSLKNKYVHKNIQKCVNWLMLSEQHHFVSLACEHYPERLKHISGPPLFLFVAGNLSLLSRHMIAFVGSRRESFGALSFTNELIQDLAKYSSAISISGLALGIDAACHQASVACGLPTIGVLGCGIDVIYPKRHKNLYANVRENGALVSEFIPSTQPIANMFPRRNRIISGLSLGTVVIEAKMKSGSLVTAKYAVEQNREVFAVPSNVNNVNAEGCHWLIKQGAKLTTCIQDIFDEIPNIQNNIEKIEKKPTESLASDPLLDSVDYSATSVDLIAKRTGKPMSDLLTQLLEYELRGLVASTAEGYIKLGA